MAFGDRYTQGSVSTDTGSPADPKKIIGHGTLWSAVAVAGDLFWSGGIATPIASIDSDTQLTLATDWPGDALDHASYSIEFLGTSRYSNIEVADRQRELLNRMRIFDSASPVFSIKTFGVDGPPGSAVVGDRYVIAAGSGTFVGHDNEIVEKTETGWLFRIPEHGWQVVDEDEHKIRTFTGSAWDEVLGSPGPQGDPGTQGPPGEDGADGSDGASAYVYIAYASDTSGTGFTTTFDASLDYIAIKTTTTPIAEPAASDFDGLWKSVRGAIGQGIQPDITVNEITSTASPAEDDRDAHDSDPEGTIVLVASEGKIYVRLTATAGVWSDGVSIGGGGGDGAIHDADAKTTPDDADEFGFLDSAASFILKKFTWTNLKAALKSYFDTLYQANDSFLPLNYLSGLTLSNNATDATNDIDIAPGCAMDDANAAMMKLASGITKRLDASWAVGSGNGGLDTGSIANACYHVWLIQRSDTGVVDVLFSTSATSPTMPADYDRKRRIGAIIRKSGAILLFKQMGREFILAATQLDFNQSAPATSAYSVTLTVPTGLQVWALVRAGGIQLGAFGAGVLFSSLDSPDEQPGGTPDRNCSIPRLGNLSGASQWGAAQMTLRTNSSGQIRARIDTSDTSSAGLFVRTLGWVDPAGAV